ncbi:MAG: DNA topoisomerase VI subunit B [Candidatus Thorarchaeota archaeon]|jgi:DNA topoisomerase-6 subunit B
MTVLNQSVEGFRSISPAEFFYRNRQMAGFGNPTQSVYSTVKELVENSLDACEDAQRIPQIKIEVDVQSSDILSIKVADNGTGLPYQHVPEAFGRVLYGSKYDQKQKRGTFGLGVTMAILYGQITTDSPVVVHTQNKSGPGRAYSLLIDVEENMPIIESEREQVRSYDGTTVTVTLRGDLKRARERVVEYIRLTAITSPHAVIELHFSGSEVIKVGGWSKRVPEVPLPSKPHPRAADLELLRRVMTKSPSKNLHDFLVESFQQVGSRTASRFLKFLGLDSSGAIESLTRADISRLSTSLRRFDGFGRPDSRCLSPVGEEAFLLSVRSFFNPSWIRYSKQKSSEWQGNPFVVEGVIALGSKFPNVDTPTLYRFANRVPLLYDASDDVMTKIMKRLNWKNYGFSGTIPVALFIHFSSTKVPYRAAGKQSLAHTAEIETAVTGLLRTLGRALKKHAGHRDQSRRDARKMREFSEMFNIVAKYGPALAETEPPSSTANMVKTLFEVNTDV